MTALQGVTVLPHTRIILRSCGNAADGVLLQDGHVSTERVKDKHMEGECEPLQRKRMH